MTFRPALQQQFSPRDATSYADCCATSAAMLADAASNGACRFNHSQVRAATNEPHPDHNSPGLRWQQVDAAVFDLTNGLVDLDVHPTGSAFAPVREACRDGRWAGLAVWRGVLVDAGYAGSSSFRKGHAVVVGYDQARKQPILGDPLVPRWQDVSWALLERACRQFLVSVGAGAGATGAYYALTRAPKPASAKYSALFEPGAFWLYSVSGGVITGRESRAFSKATSAPCSAPRVYPWPAGGKRKLVRITAGALDGGYVEPGTSHVSLKVKK